MPRLSDELLRKIKVLNETVWEGRVPYSSVQDWLENFDEDDRREALFLLSHFVFYGSKEMRELLRALFRDFVRNPAYQQIRDLEHTSEVEVVRREFRRWIKRTRFLGVGNPSESGTHLLYFFRQENTLPKDAFIHAHELFARDPATGDRSIRNPDIDRYIFIDDLCGSGDQASVYSRRVLDELKQYQSTVEVRYLVLFATESGIERVRRDTLFDYAEALCVFDQTDKSLSSESRLLASCPDELSSEEVCRVATEAGRKVWSRYPLGYRDGQLLIGFAHNTPDNSLPIFWGGPDPLASEWHPIFPRYHKIYDWSHYGG